MMCFCEREVLITNDVEYIGWLYANKGKKGEKDMIL